MRISPTILSLGTLVCSSLWAQTVEVDWDRNADFGAYETYAWEEGTNAPAKVSHQRVVKAIEDELGVRSLFKNEQEPDIYVVYYASGSDEFEITGGKRVDWRDSGAVKVESFIAGTLVVDVVDAKRNRLIWRGVASDTVSREPRKNAEIIQKAVSKLFERFPGEN